MLTHNETYANKVAFKIGGGFRFWGEEQTDGVLYKLKDKSVFLPNKGDAILSINCQIPKDVSKLIQSKFEEGSLDNDKMIGYMILKHTLL